MSKERLGENQDERSEPKIIVKLDRINLDQHVGAFLSLGELLDVLRYAGAINFDSGSGELTLYPPENSGGWHWAELQINNIKSFGLPCELREYPVSNVPLPDRPIRTKIVEYEEIKMLTDGLYPERYCPKTNREELGGVTVARSGLASLVITRGWEKPKHGHKIQLKIIDWQGGKHVLMDTNTRERMSALAAARWCPAGAKVLIAGLGLGVVALKLAKKAHEITVVEVDSRVKNLVWHKLTKWCSSHRYPAELKIELNDIQTYLRETTKLYDFIYIDIWEHTKPKPSDLRELKELAKKRLNKGGRVMIWQERRMRREAK